MLQSIRKFSRIFVRLFVLVLSINNNNSPKFVIKIKKLNVKYIIRTILLRGETLGLI